MKTHNKGLVFSLLLIIIYCFVYYLFSLDITGPTAEEGGRVDRMILIVLILVFLVSAVKTVSYKIPVRGLDFRKSLIALVILYIICALITAPNFNRLLAYLPTILYVFLSFYFFFKNAYTGKFTKKQIFIFYLLILGVAILGFIKVYTYKSTVLSAYYMQSNGMGYLFVLLIPVLCMLFNNKILLLLMSSLFLLPVLHSSKRGAIIIAAICVIYITLSLFINSKKKYRVFYLILIAILSGFSLYYLNSHDYLLYRFDMEGGSGRDILYSSLFNSWYNGDIKTFLLGSGFFSSYELADGLMAHNDWLQVLTDMGLLGLLAYLVLYTSFLFQRGVVRRYNRGHLLSFDVCMLLWFLKSMVSGVLMDKGSFLIFSCLGLVLGFTYRNRKQMYTEINVPS